MYYIVPGRWRACHGLAEQFQDARIKPTVKNAGRRSKVTGPGFAGTGVRVTLGGKMSRRTIALATVLFLTLLSEIGLATVGPSFLIRINLERRGVFDLAADIGLEPVYRWGNEFYVVVDGLGLDHLDKAGLQYAVVETDPFVAGYYFADSKSPFTEPGRLSKLGAQPLDLFDGGALWKSDQPLLWEARLAGEAPVQITGEKIPLVYMTPMTSTGMIAPDPLLDTVAARISQDSLVAYNMRMEKFRTRYTYTDSNLAAQNYLRQKFLSFGYTDVKSDTFSIGYGWYSHNVICTKLGTIEPDKLIIVGAHFDSYNQQSDPMIWAPGADDNASGTAAVLEIARALANIPTRKTIIFIPFGAEEQGLYGSSYYSWEAQTYGWNIELMLNMDMIGWNPDEINNVAVKTNPASVAYANLASQLAQSRTTLLPYVNTSAGGGSDHYYFGQRGYHFIYAEEGDFDTPGWHTNIDTTARLNFPYWTDVVRMVGMTAYYVAKAPAAVQSVQLWDVGDGQSLEIQWQKVIGADIATYRVYYGSAPGQYTASVDVPAAGPGTTRLNGLTEGELYFATVTAIDTSGAESIARTETYLAPYRLPRVPSGVLANVEYLRLELLWDPTVELDFDHFTIYKGTDSTALSVFIPSLATNFYTDMAVSGGTRYYYRVVAVDHDANTSSTSNLVSGIPATFDQGTLLADLTSETSGNPSETEAWNVYNSIFSNYLHGYYRYEDYLKPVDKSELGQYGTLYWLDDDYQWESWPADHWAKLNWFISYGNNVVVTGWATPNEAKSAGVLYDLCHISAISRINAFDCVGGIGVMGFPSVTFDTAKVYPDWSGTLNNIWTLTPADGLSQPILLYNSAINDPARESQPVAVRYDSGSNKVAFIGLPLYFIRNQDARALVAALGNWFGLTQHAMGDLNGDGVVDVLDVIVLIGTAFEGQTPPNGMASADVNGDCVVDVFDVIYLIDYTFSGGPAPGPGCA